MTAAIELIGITKRFPGVVANDDVNLSVEPGEIHAICGENGAGKSTLMKILYGMQPADEGVMKINGEEVHFSSPTDAINAGIGMVHQHFMLADQMTVLENVILGSEPTKIGGLIDFDEAERHSARSARRTGSRSTRTTSSRPSRSARSSASRSSRCCSAGARILILDEPTAVLVPQEVEELFRNLRELQAGATIIFIDHKLQEVLEISDRITVIRRGKTVATVDADSVTAADLAELMVGSELPSPETTESTVTDEVALEVTGLTVLDDDGRPAVTTSRSPCTRARCSASPASRATGSRAHRRDHRHGRPGGRAHHAAGREHHQVVGTTPARGRHRVRPPGSSVRRPPPRRHAVGERRARPSDQTPVLEGVLDRPRRRPPAHRGDPRGVRRPVTRRRRQRPGAVGRQPAEADHRARAHRRPARLHRRPPDPWHRRRSPGRGVEGHP
jgi:ABC-type branched-subunit amino acid transport system ATPase component